jgi:hypothetical protein
MINNFFSLKSFQKGRSSFKRRTIEIPKVVGIPAPTIISSGPAEAIFTDIDDVTQNLSVSFTNKGNGSGRLILMRANQAEVSTPTNNVIYQKYNFAQHDFIFGGRGSGPLVFWVGGRFASLVMDFGDIQGLNITFKKEAGGFWAFDVFEYNGDFAAGTAIYNTTPLSFTQNLPPPPVPTIGASELSFTNITNTSVTLNWVSGNGTNTLIIVRKDVVIDAEPNTGQFYSANPVFGSGAALGGGFVVFSFKGNSVNVTNLEAGANYHFTVIEFNFLPEAITYANSLKISANVNTTI